MGLLLNPCPPALFVPCFDVAICLQVSTLRKQGHSMSSGDLSEVHGSLDGISYDLSSLKSRLQITADLSSLILQTPTLLLLLSSANPLSFSSQGWMMVWNNSEIWPLVRYSLSLNTLNLRFRSPKRTPDSSLHLLRCCIVAQVG